MWLNFVGHHLCSPCMDVIMSGKGEMSHGVEEREYKHTTMLWLDVIKEMPCLLILDRGIYYTCKSHCCFLLVSWACCYVSSSLRCHCFNFGIVLLPCLFWEFVVYTILTFPPFLWNQLQVWLTLWKRLIWLFTP